MLRPERVVFRSRLPMTTTVLTTDLLPPLAAYVRLRTTALASFLLESVDQGRLGRYSFVGCGERLVSFEEAAEEQAVYALGLGVNANARIEVGGHRFN